MTRWTCSSVSRNSTTTPNRPPTAVPMMRLKEVVKVFSADFCMHSTAAIIEKNEVSSLSQPSRPQMKTAMTVLIMRIPMWKW